MNVTNDTSTLVASHNLQELTTVSLGGSGENCRDEQTMSDVNSIVQPNVTSATGEVLSQVEAHSVTTMLWSSEGILRQALMSPGLVNFAGPDEEKPTKDSSAVELVNIKSPSTPLPPMSELQRPGNLPTSTLSLHSEAGMTQSLDEGNRSTSVQTTGILDTQLLALHNEETFNGVLSQFPCTIAYKILSSSDLLASNSNLNPLPPISEVQKAAAGQLLSSTVRNRDQLLLAECRSKDLANYQTSSSPLPSDVAGSLLLSSARGPLPTMSSSQVSSLLSALNSDLSNHEMPGKELSSLGEMELSPSRKSSESFGLGTASKVPVLQLHLSSSNKVSALTQTGHLGEADISMDTPFTSTIVVPTNSGVSDEKSSNFTQLRIIPTVSRIDNDNELKNNANLPFNLGTLGLKTCNQPTIIVKQETNTAQNSKKLKIVATKRLRARKKNVSETESEPKNSTEGVSCFKCSFCPFLSLDKDGITTHVAQEHGELAEKTSHQSDLTPQEIRCPGCPNVFFSIQSLQVHLGQDHRVSDSEVQQIISCLYPLPAPTIDPDLSSESLDSKVDLPKQKKSRKPPSDVEVYVDDMGKIHARSGSSKTDHPPSSLNTDLTTPDETCSLGGDVCESSDNENETIITENKDSEADDGSILKKRGRPRGSRNIGITALRKQNPSLRLGEKELGYCCGVHGCAVRLRSHDNIEYHRRCHTTGVQFLCPECQHGFNQWRLLTAHLWRAHVIDMELYACDQCGFKTNSYSKLMNLHKRIHGVERPFLCDTCGKGFKTNKQLRNHKNIHNNSVKSRPLKSGECDICYRHFADKRLLRLHKDTVHEKLRPFLCNYCGYSASSRSTLKMHMRQHTGEKPFACSECEYRTADHNSLRRHRMRHTGKKQYQCPHCAYACIQSSTYKTHLRTKHPGQDAGLLFSCPHCPFRTIKQDNHVAHLAEHQAGALVARKSQTVLHSAVASTPQLDTTKSSSGNEKTSEKTDSVMKFCPKVNQDVTFENNTNLGLKCQETGVMSVEKNSVSLKIDSKKTQSVKKKEKSKGKLVVLKIK